MNTPKGTNPKTRGPNPSEIFMADDTAHRRKDGEKEGVNDSTPPLLPSFPVRISTILRVARAWIDDPASIVEAPIGGLGFDAALDAAHDELLPLLKGRLGEFESALRDEAAGAFVHAECSDGSVHGLSCVLFAVPLQGELSAMRNFVADDTAFSDFTRAARDSGLAAPGAAIQFARLLVPAAAVAELQPGALRALAALAAQTTVLPPAAAAAEFHNAIVALFGGEHPHTDQTQNSDGAQIGERLIIGARVVREDLDDSHNDADQDTSRRTDNESDTAADGGGEVELDWFDGWAAAFLPSWEGGDGDDTMTVADLIGRMVDSAPICGGDAPEITSWEFAAGEACAPCACGLPSPFGRGLAAVAAAKARRILEDELEVIATREDYAGAGASLPSGGTLRVVHLHNGPDAFLVSLEDGGRAAGPYRIPTNEEPWNRDDLSEALGCIADMRRLHTDPATLPGRKNPRGGRPG